MTTLPPVGRAQATRGAVLTGIAQAYRIVLNFASSVLLARLLTPADFGLVAMAATIAGIVSLVQELRLIPLSQARLYIVAERIRWVEFGHWAALKTRYPVAFRLPSYGGAPYA
jgi:hypothetical protein